MRLGKLGAPWGQRQRRGEGVWPDLMEREPKGVQKDQGGRGLCSPDPMRALVTSDRPWGGGHISSHWQLQLCPRAAPQGESLPSASCLPISVTPTREPDGRLISLLSMINISNMIIHPEPLPSPGSHLAHQAWRSPLPLPWSPGSVMPQDVCTCWHLSQASPRAVLLMPPLQDLTPAGSPIPIYIRGPVGSCSLGS